MTYTLYNDILYNQQVQGNRLINKIIQPSFSFLEQ